MLSDSVKFFAVGKQFMEFNTNSILDLIQNNDELITEINEIVDIINFIILRTKNALYQFEDVNIVDGEIIFRSAMEIFTKYFYIICLNQKSIIKERLYEYWVEVRELHTYQNSVRIKKLVNQDNASGFLLKIGILSDEEETRIREKFNQKHNGKQSVEQYLSNTWSFGGIVKYIEEEYTGLKLISPMQMRRKYMFASHFAHADVSALMFIAERQQKEPFRRAASNFMHIIGRANDCTMYLLWTACLLADVIGKNTLLNDFVEKFKAETEEIKRIQQKTRRTVESNPLYDNIRE